MTNSIENILNLCFSWALVIPRDDDWCECYIPHDELISIAASNPDTLVSDVIPAMLEYQGGLSCFIDVAGYEKKQHAFMIIARLNDQTP